MDLIRPDVTRWPRLLGQCNLQEQYIANVLKTFMDTLKSNKLNESILLYVEIEFYKYNITPQGLLHKQLNVPFNLIIFI